MPNRKKKVDWQLVGCCCLLFGAIVLPPVPVFFLLKFASDWANLQAAFVAIPVSYLTVFALIALNDWAFRLRRDLRDKRAQATLVADDFANISYDSKEGIVRLDWKVTTTPMSIEKYKEIWMEFIETAVQNKASLTLENMDKWRYRDGGNLYDLRQDVFFEKLTETADRYVSVSGESGLKLSHEMGMEKPDGSYFDVNSFYQEAEALKWLTGETLREK